MAPRPSLCSRARNACCSWATGPIHTRCRSMLVTRYSGKDRQDLCTPRVRPAKSQFSEYATTRLSRRRLRFAYLPKPRGALHATALSQAWRGLRPRNKVSFADPVFGTKAGGGVGGDTRSALAVLARSVRGKEAIQHPRLPSSGRARGSRQDPGQQRRIFLRDKAQENRQNPEPQDHALRPLFNYCVTKEISSIPSYYTHIV